VDAKYQELKKIYENAIESDKLMKELKGKIEDAKLNGIQTLETTKLLNLAESAFLRGDYELALSRLKEAQLSFALETKGEFSLVHYVKRNPLQSGGISLAAGAITIASTLLIRWRLLRTKLRLLNEEEELLIGLMKVVQRECFEEGRMSMEEYENTMMQYETRLNIVIQDKIETESKLANMMKIKGGKIKALKAESARLKELIKETQKQYFETGKLETRIYENMIKSYADKLAEVEEKLATLEAQAELRKSGMKLSLSMVGENE
jgi:hypothetical protein